MPSAQAGPGNEARPQHGAIQRAAILLYGTVVYILFFATFVYFMAASLALALLMALWRPIDGVLWEVSGGPQAGVLVGISMLGWGCSSRSG